MLGSWGLNTKKTFSSLSASPCYHVSSLEGTFPEIWKQGLCTALGSYSTLLLPEYIWYIKYSPYNIIQQYILSQFYSKNFWGSSQVSLDLVRGQLLGQPTMATEDKLYTRHLSWKIWLDCIKKQLPELRGCSLVIK